MSRYMIGIDTGGTCTDAALIDVHTRTVLATSKVPTTPYRLSDGVSHALSEILDKSGIPPGKIHSIAVSTTLATNSVVENKGARVGLFVIGYVRHFKLPVTAVIYLKGGHTIHGAEEEPLELEYLVETLARLKTDVDAYAVCSAMSTVNPVHELVAEKAISLIDPKPVFCSHQASAQAGMKGRAATASLHAKLMPLMQTFVEHVGEAMNSMQLACPLKIVTGNGSTVSPEDAVRQSGITVASGPACTALFGGQHIETDALVVDVGGTTTDIAMIRNGEPVVAPDGCTIGSWVTHIPSVDMFTGGIGGDSLVILKKDGTIAIGPTRVSPVCMAVTMPDPAAWIGPDTTSRCIGLESSGTSQPSKKGPIFECIQENGPATLSVLQTSTGISAVLLDKQLEHLSRANLIIETGFTPTDALHVLDRADFGDKSRACSAAETLARSAGIEIETFCKMVVNQTEESISNLVIGYIARQSWGDALVPVLEPGNQNPILSINFSLNIPIVGLGAAARFFLPAVAKRLSTTTLFPEFCEVGNAIGAAFSTIHQSLESGD